MKKLFYICLMFIGLTTFSCSSDNDNHDQIVDTEELTWNTPENKEKYRVNYINLSYTENNDNTYNFQYNVWLWNGTENTISGNVVVKYTNNAKNIDKIRIPVNNLLPKKDATFGTTVTLPYNRMPDFDNTEFILYFVPN